jgi:hypothetical protein
MERGQTLSVRHAGFRLLLSPHASSGLWPLTIVLKNDVITSESGHKGRAKKNISLLTEYVSNAEECRGEAG